MKAFFGSIATVLLLAAPAAQAWTEVAYETIFANQPTFQQIILRNSKAEYQEVMVQVMNPNGARIQRAEIITEQGWSKPVWRLEGDYRFGMQRSDVFQKAKIRYFRTYLTTLRPGEPVRLRVMMR
ncbi:hypothetical protein [Bdellovibrio bacteriovorus]|uniref:Uncharacterized protein n=1 Tax=Bdellovibrio bacteriovorus str. Tiberius TaxID=1069642 RepID=K7ZC73_BDEBC|nr:hypothetical protein [Bdellovibrio bacteriovorus]AFY02944.1 hypothetical protein Bdt_3269 [Bdellovibrio bacteriovorus str. Tiberius]